MAREYGLPAIANVADATRVLHDGDVVRVDALRGTVEILERRHPPSPEFTTGEDV